MQQEPAHYHARGEEISLEPANYLACDLIAAQAGGVDAAVIESVRDAGSEIRNSLLLVAQDELDKRILKDLDDAGALQPVYCDPTGTLVVVLPEVRVEVDDEVSAAEVRATVSADSSIEVVQESHGRLVLRPTSGRGTEAVEIANRIFEQAAPAAVQPRMLRVVERPDSTA